MEMLLRHVTIEDLRTLLIRHRDRSPLPELFNPRQIAQAVALAQKNGVWQDLDQHQDPRQPIEVVRRSEFRDFQRSGERGLGEKAMGRKRRALNRAAPRSIARVSCAGETQVVSSHAAQMRSCR